MNDNYPSNSDKSKRPPAEVKPQKFEKVVKNEPIVGNGSSRKKSIFGELIQGDIRSAMREAGEQIVIPALKNLVYSAVTGSLSMMIFGDMRYGGTTWPGSGSPKNTVGNRTPYNSLYAGSTSHSTIGRSVSFDYNDEIKFRSQADAEDVRATMNATIMDYGLVTLFAMYQFAGLEDRAPYTYLNYGWTSMKRSRIVGPMYEYDHESGQNVPYWVIDLPKPLPID